MGEIVAIDFSRARDREAWAAYLASRPDSHASDHANWRLFFRALYGFQDLSLAYRHAGRLCGVASLYHIRSPFFGNHLVSSPFFGYGGLYADSPAIESALLERVRREAGRLGVRFVEFRLRRPLAHPYRVNRDFLEFDLQFSGDARSAWQRLSSNARQNVRKSRRTPFQFTVTREAEDAYRLLSRTIRDLGTPFHDRRFFQLLLEYFPQEVSFSQVRLEGRVVAAGVLLHFGERLLTPYIGSLKGARASGSNYCQYWGIIEECLDRGVRCFELGRSPRGSRHARFKKKWGARPVEVCYNYLALGRGPYRSAATPPPLFRWASRVWSHLPLPLTRRLGHRFFRYIP